MLKEFWLITILVHRQSLQKLKPLFNLPHVLTMMTPLLMNLLSPALNSQLFLLLISVKIIVQLPTTRTMSTTKMISQKTTMMMEETTKRRVKKMRTAQRNQELVYLHPILAKVITQYQIFLCNSV